MLIYPPYLQIKTSFVLSILRFFVSSTACNVKNLDVCYSVRSSDESSTQDSTTPLIEAAVSDNEKVVTLLLKHGASVNFPKVHVTAFMFQFYSAEFKQTCSVKFVFTPPTC